MVGDLVLGAFDLINPTGSTYKTFVEAEGTVRGTPVPIEVAVKSWLQDGSVVVTQGYDNRELNIQVRLVASNLTNLATAEAALVAELGKPNLLTWTGPNGPASVFKVVTSSMAFNDNDLMEARGTPWRTYSLRLVCEAFVQSAAEVTVAALAASGTTTTLVDNGSATTNWTGTTNGSGATVAVVSGAVGVTTAALTGTVTIALTRTASITTSSTKYLVVDWKPETPYGAPDLRAYSSGTELTRIGQGASPTAGYTRTWFYVPGASVTVLRLDSTTTPTEPASPSVVRSLYIDNIDRTDIKPTIGTARQLLRSIDVTGSARTQGSIAIEHSTNALGDVLAYFFPDSDKERPAGGYSPPLRQYRVSGGTVTGDANQVSGSTENLVGATATFDIPVQRLLAGAHLLMARLTTGSASPPIAATVTWTASTRVNATTVGDTTTQAVALSLVSGLQLYPLGLALLPTVDVDLAATTAVVRITLTATSVAAVTFDEGWLFNTTIGQLVQVSCGTGTAASGGPARRAFIEPATVARPRPVVRIGHAADRSDSFYPAGSLLDAWDFPQFSPPRVNVLTVTTNALDASTTFRHYPHWHTHAAS